MIPSVEYLQKQKSDKENSKLEIYKVVLNKCIEKIVYTNKHTDKTFIIFEVPQVLIGYPLYDMKSCLLYIIKKLFKHGYIIEFIEPFYLYIDWGSSNPIINNVSNVSINNSSNNNNDKVNTNLTKLLNKKNNNIEFIFEDAFPNFKKSKKKKKRFI